MRNRRNEGRLAAAGAAGALATIGLRVWAKAVQRPVDSLAIIGASATSLVIIVNAIFLQTGPHPAPFFALPISPPTAVNSRPNVVGVATPKPVEAVPTRLPAGPRTPQAVSARRNDPIADLIGSPSRVIAVQHVLSDFGYGQIKPSGILDEPTSAAIEKFEREHKLPVTGRLSDRLLSGLAAIAGHPLE